MDWSLLPIVILVVALIFAIGYKIGHKAGYRQKERAIDTVGELIIYNFDDGIEPELYLELDVQPESFKDLPHVIFRTRNVKLGKLPRASQK